MTTPPITEISFKNKHRRSKSFSECATVDEDVEAASPQIQKEPTTTPTEPPPKKNVAKRPPISPHKKKTFSKKPNRRVKTLRRNRVAGVMSRSVISSLTSWTGSRNSLMDDSTASELPSKPQDIFRSKKSIKNSKPKAETPKAVFRKQEAATPQRKNAAPVNDATPVRHNRATATPNAPMTPPPPHVAVSQAPSKSPSIPLPVSYSLSCNESMSTTNSASIMGGITKRAVDNVLDNFLFEEDDNYSVKSLVNKDEEDSYYGNDLKSNLESNVEEKRTRYANEIGQEDEEGPDYIQDTNTAGVEDENTLSKSTTTDTDITNIFKKVPPPPPPPEVETVLDDDSYFERDVEVSSLVEDAMSALEQEQGTAPDHWHFNVRSLRHKKDETAATMAAPKEDPMDVPVPNQEDTSINEDSKLIRVPVGGDSVDVDEDSPSALAPEEKLALASYSGITSLRSKESASVAMTTVKSIAEPEVPAESSVCSSRATSKPLSTPDHYDDVSLTSNKSNELVVAVGSSPRQNSSAWWQDGHDEETGTFANGSHKGGKTVKSIDSEEEPPFTFRKTFMILFLIIGIAAITGGIAAFVTSKHQTSQDGDEPAVQIASPPRITPPPSPLATASPSSTMPTTLPTSQPVTEPIVDAAGQPTAEPPTATEPPTVAPTTVSPPTASPMIVETASPTIDHLKLSLYEKIELFSPESLPALENATTPQAQAFNWTLQQADPSLEQYALATLHYSSTTKWSNDAGWMTSSSVCDWYGIVCREGEVMELTLSFNNLASTLPDELSLLTDLEVLSMSGAAGTGKVKGSLTGSIPSTWGERLVKLVALELYDNQLTGELPATLQYMTDLEMLNLDGNEVFGTLPTELGALTSLEIFDVSSNDFSGTIPTEIGLLSNLLSFKLSDNEITGFLPTHLGNIKSLKEFRAQNNVLMGSIPKVLYNLSNLSWLDLRNNELDNILPPSIGLLSNIEGLLLDDNRFTGQIPIQLSLLTDLRVMTLSKNLLTGSVPTPICANMTSLSEFTYSDDCDICPCCTSCLNNTV